MVSVTNLILGFSILQNKFQQTNKTEINHIIDKHIKFEVSLHFWGIWPTVRGGAHMRRGVSGGAAAQHSKEANVEDYD